MSGLLTFANATSSLRSLVMIRRPLMPAKMPVFAISVRHVWGNENGPTPRGKNRPNKHREEWYSKGRAAKILKVELPDYDFQRRMERQEVSPAEIREFMKEKGIMPASRYQEKATYISCTGGIVEEFVPPEGDGRASLVSKEGAKQSVAGVTKKGKSYMAVRKIRQFEDDFDPRVFAQTAQEVFVKAQQALANRDEEELHKFATEKAFPEMTHNTQRKTIQWQLVKSLEPPRVVQIRTMDILTKNNIFAQVTVRMNTQQLLAVYDRFGRLIHGSPVVAKDVLEYVVFEKHLANVYGSWRVHGKILPEWLKEKPSGRLTHVLREEERLKEEEEGEAVGDASQKDQKQQRQSEEEEEVPAAETTIYDRFGRAIGKAKD